MKMENVRVRFSSQAAVRTHESGQELLKLVKIIDPLQSCGFFLNGSTITYTNRDIPFYYTPVNIMYSSQVLFNIYHWIAWHFIYSSHIKMGTNRRGYDLNSVTSIITYKFKVVNQPIEGRLYQNVTNRAQACYSRRADYQNVLDTRWPSRFQSLNRIRDSPIRWVWKPLCGPNPIPEVHFACEVCNPTFM